MYWVSGSLTILDARISASDSGVRRHAFGLSDPLRNALAATRARVAWQAAAVMLCNDMDEATAARTLDRLVDDSAALLGEHVDTSGYTRQVPRTYVHLTGTSAIRRNFSSGRLR